MEQPYRLGALLLHKQLIDQSQLDAALQLQLTRPQTQLGQALIELGFVTEHQIQRALKKQSRVRLYAACITFFMAPFSICQANTDDIESLPEYSYTQVADPQFADEYNYNNFAMNQNGNGAAFDVIELSTAAVWYLSQGGIQESELQHVPVKLNLSAANSNTYTLNLSVSF